MIALIPPLPDLNAAPTAPKSAIAPQELVGQANFPSLLGGLKVDIAQVVPPSEVRPDDAGRIASDLAPEPKALPSSPMAAGGNSFPQIGMRLPNGLPDMETPFAQQPPEGRETSGGIQTGKSPESQSARAMVSGGTKQASLVLPRIEPRDLAQSEVGKVSSRAPSPLDTPDETGQDAAIPGGDVFPLLQDVTGATELASEASAPLLPERSVKQGETPAVEEVRAPIQLSSLIASSRPSDQPEADGPDKVPLGKGVDAPIDTSRVDTSDDAKPLRPKPLAGKGAEVNLAKDKLVDQRPDETTDIGRAQFVNEVPIIASSDNTVPTRVEADPAAGSMGLSRVADGKDLSMSLRPLAASMEPPSNAPLTRQGSEPPRQQYEIRTNDIAIEKRPAEATPQPPIENKVQAAKAETAKQESAKIADPDDAIRIPTTSAPKLQTQLATPEAQDSKLEPARFAQTSQAAVQLAAKSIAENQLARSPKAVESRAKIELNLPRTPAAASALPPVPEISSVRPVTPVEGEADVDPVSSRAPLTAVVHSVGSPVIAPSQTGQSTLEFGAPQTTAAQSQANATPVALQTGTPAPVTDTSTPSRLAPQLENTIDQLAEARSAAQASRPELTVRHQEFGAITMRLEAMGNDFRATLSARDPGFVPAIQTALAERSVAASSETTGSGAQRGNEQGSAQSGSQSGSHTGQFAGSPGGGWNPQGNYGSSTGAGQGTSQPYTGQTENRDEDSGSERGNSLGRATGSPGEGEIFA